MHQKCVWWPGPAGGACSTTPYPLTELKGRRGERGGVGNGRGRKGRGDGRERGGEKERRDPQCLKCVDANETRSQSTICV